MIEKLNQKNSLSLEESKKISTHITAVEECLNVFNNEDLFISYDFSNILKLIAENNLQVEDLSKAIKELKKHKIQILVTDLATNNTIYDVNYKKSAIVIGNEGNGVSKEILELADKKIKIPMIRKN